MRKFSFCFLFVVLPSVLSASLSTNNNQSLQAFLKNMIVEVKDRTAVDGSNEAENSLTHDETEVQDDETEVEGVPPGMGALGCYASSTAFHVYLSSSRCYHTGANIQFNQVLVNTYNRYNVHTGIFTVLYTGYYVFTWTVAAEHKSWFSAELRVNGALRGTVMADSDVGGRASGIHPATGFVITRVTSNQHVYIRFVSGSGCTLKSDSRTRATFSGWRMY